MSNFDEKGDFAKGNSIGLNSRFSSENQPANAGRKPSIFNRLESLTKKEFGVELSKTDYDTLYAWALERTPEELKELQDEGSSDVPLIVLVLIKSLLGDIADGKMNSLKMIMEQINKKPDEVITTERKPLHEIFNFTDNDKDK